MALSFLGNCGQAVTNGHSVAALQMPADAIVIMEEAAATGTSGSLCAHPYDIKLASDAAFDWESTRRLEKRWEQ